MAGDPIDEKGKQKASFASSLKAVLWSFLGIRKRSEYQKDAEQLNPVHVIFAGILVAAVFVLVLIMIVRSVVK